MHKIIIVAATLSLGGCATVNKALQWGAAVNDVVADESRDNLCNRLSIRAIKEEFDTPAEKEAYNGLCGNTLYIER